MFQRLFALRSASTLKRTRSFPLINLKEKASTTNRFSVRQTSSGPCPKSVRISNEIYLPILSGEAQNEKKKPSANSFGVYFWKSGTGKVTISLPFLSGANISSTIFKIGYDDGANFSSTN